jgi:hypothetical protein
VNYIKKIQAENANLKRQMLDAQEELQNFRAFLFSAKFTGTDSDGDRKDWIATTDVAARLQNICSLLFIETV